MTCYNTPCINSSDSVSSSKQFTMLNESINYDLAGIGIIVCMLSSTILFYQSPINIFGLLFLAAGIALVSMFYPKEFLIFTIYTCPINFQILHPGKDLFGDLVAGMNPNAIYTIIVTSIALPIIIYKAVKSGWRPRPFLLIYLLYFCSGIIALTYSKVFFGGIKYLIIIAYPTMGFIMYQYLRRAGMLNSRLLIRHIFISIIGWGVIGYSMFIMGVTHFPGYRDVIVGDPSDGIYRYYAPFGHGPVQTAMTLVIVCLMLIYYYDNINTTKRRGRRKIYGISLLIICSYLMIVTYSRVPLIAWFLLITLVYLSKRKFLRESIVVTTVIVVLAISPMGHRMKLLMNIDAISSSISKVHQHSRKELPYSGRGLLYSAGIEAIKRSPIWGHGLGMAPIICRNILVEERGFRFAATSTIGPHSEILFSWIDMGLPGLFIILAYIGCLYIELAKSIKRKNKYAILGMLVYIYYTLSLVIEPQFKTYRCASFIMYMCFAMALPEKTIVTNGRDTIFDSMAYKSNKR